MSTQWPCVHSTHHISIENTKIIKTQRVQAVALGLIKWTASPVSITLTWASLNQIKVTLVTLFEIISKTDFQSFEFDGCFTCSTYSGTCVRSEEGDLNCFYLKFLSPVWWVVHPNLAHDHTRCFLSEKSLGWKHIQTSFYKMISGWTKYRNVQTNACIGERRSRSVSLLFGPYLRNQSIWQNQAAGSTITTIALIWENKTISSAA